MTQVCTRCVLDTTDASIDFDEAGVCSHCRNYDQVFRPGVEAAARGDRLPALHSIIATIKKKGRKKQYDCIVGVSGGVDSTFVLMKAKDFGLRPLAVHFDSGWDSELAVANIERATKLLDVDLITQVADWPEMRDLQLAFLRASVPDCDIPQDHAFPAIAFKTAARYRIKYNLSGYNAASESMLPRSWAYLKGDLRHLRAIHRQFGQAKTLKKYPTLGMFKRDFWYRYMRGIKTVSILNYVDYEKEAAKREIIERLEWRDYGGKHYESQFTRFFQGQYLPLKFGYDKRKAHYSSLIVAGQMTRDQALARLEEPTYDPTVQARDRVFISKKLGITPATMEELIAAPPRRHEDYPTMAGVYAAAHSLRSTLRRKIGRS